MSLILLNTAIFLRSSHSALCAVFEHKAEDIQGPLGRELMLGDRKTVLAIFNDFKKGFSRLHTSENLDLVISKADISNQKCEPHVFGAVVNFPLKFGSEEFGIITGSISYASFFVIALMLVFGALIVFVGVKLLTTRLSRELEEAIVKPMRQLSQGEQLPKNGNIPTEILEIESNFKNLKNDIVAKERITQDLTRSKELGEQAERLAHDIISPLNALNSVIEDLGEIDSRAKKTLSLAVSHIEDITRNLHKKSRDSRTKNCYTKLGTLIRDVISEKRVEYKHKNRIEFEIRKGGTSEDVLPIEYSVELKRILSNLVNNSVEAIPDSGQVTIDYKANNSEMWLTVEDNGRGIPSENLPKLMKKGATFKKGGSGIGLYYARQVIESWGGSISITSHEGKGTQIKIVIPSTVAKYSIKKKGSACILIDNDELTRLVWEDAAAKDGIALTTYSNPSTFFEHEKDIDRNTTIYIDSDLGLEKRGEEIAKDIQEIGFKKIYLTTGFPKEHFEKGFPWLKAVLSKTPAWREKEVRNAAS